MRTARQGAFDGLCGIYSIINALDPAGLSIRRSPLHKDLFVQLTHSLGAASLLHAMEGGLEAKELIRAARRSFEWLWLEHQVRLTIAQPCHDADFDTVLEYVSYVRETAAKSCTAVILGFFIPGSSHWSVVQQVVGRRITLRDSYGIPSLDVDRFSLDRGQYRFSPGDTLVIERDFPE